MTALPLVLAPGLNCTPALFAAQQAAFGADRAIHYVDHTRDDTLAGIVKRFLAVAPSRFALAGLSLGGYIAFEIVRQAPERVDRLALLDTRASGDTPEDRDRRERLIRFAEDGRFADVHGVLWQRLVHPARLSDKPLEAIVKGMMADTGPEAFIRQQKSVLSRDDYRPLLPAIAVPTLVVVGAEDQITPVAHAEEMAKAIAGAVQVTIPDCGHLSTLEQPDVVNAAMARWLAR
ncbi:MAG: alpha/beta fold hydrolase [Beijerinckiaceae bacterium]